MGLQRLAGRRRHRHGDAEIARGLEAEIEILAQQRRREGRGEVEIDQRVALVLRERRAEHAGIHEVEKGVTRHAGLLREDGNLGEVLDHDAEEYVVRDLAAVSYTHLTLPT